MNKSCSAATCRTALLIFLAALSFPSAVFSEDEFTEVDDGAFEDFVQADTKSWGNPIWGDISGDGYLDLIIPTNTTQPIVLVYN